MGTVNTALRFLSGPAVKGLKDVERQAGRTSSSAKKLAAGMAAIGVGFVATKLVRDVVRVSAEFEQLRAQLKTIGASNAFDGIAKFARETPNSLQEVTRSFIGLKARGFDPTEKAMRDIGNLGAAFGKPIETAMQAVTQAAFGEAEMLKQFGIIMRQQGDQVTITFNGVTKTVQKDSKAIFNALLEISNQNFGNAMGDQMDTFNGAVSNLNDTWEQLLDALGNGSGLMHEVLTPAVQTLTGALGVLVTGLKTSKGEWKLALGEMLQSLVPVLQGMRDFMEFIPGMGAGVDDLSTVIRGLQRDAAILSSQGLHEIFLSSVAAKDGLDGVKSSAEGAGEAAKKLADLLSKVNVTLIGTDFTTGIAERMAKAFEGRMEDFFNSNDLDMAGLERQLAEAYEAGWEDWKRGIEANGQNRVRVEFQEPTLKQKFVGIATEFGSGVQQSLEQQLPALFAGLAGDFTHALVTGELDKFFKNLAKNFANIVANILANAVSSAIGGQLAGTSLANLGKFGGIAAFGAAFVAGAIGAFDRARAVQPGFRASGAEDGSFRIFENAVFEFAEAVQVIADVIRSVRGQLNSLFGPIGGFAFNTGDGAMGGGGSSEGVSFDKILAGSGILGGITNGFNIFVQELNGQWTVAIEGIATGFGETLEDALGQMLDVFVQRIPAMIEDGRLAVEHIPDALVEVLKNSGAQSFDELKEALEVATDVFLKSLGPLEAELFTGLNTMISNVQEAIRVGLPLDVAADAVRNQLLEMTNALAGANLFPQLADKKAIVDQFRSALDRLGISGKEAAEILGRARQAVRFFNQSLKQNVLSQLADAAERFGVATELSVKARVLEVKLQFLTLKMQLKMLGLWEQYGALWRELFRLAKQEARKEGRAAANAAGFQHGSGGFLDFGQGTAAVLHGTEQVITAKEGESLAAMQFKAIRAASGGKAMMMEARRQTRALESIERSMRRQNTIDPILSRGAMLRRLAG